MNKPATTSESGAPLRVEKDSTSGRLTVPTQDLWPPTGQ
jgi:hypothetical protein